MSKTVLVTGGSGFIGTVICKQLVDAGHTVINVDRRKKPIDGVTQYPFDINNHQVEGIINLMKPDTVIHLAADHEVARSVTEPGVFYENNVSNTIQLLNSCVKAGVKNFIFSGTSAVYGDPEIVPTPENTPCNPLSPYASSKAMVERMLADYHAAYGLNYVVLRYFNAAGAMPDMSHGYTQDPASHLVPILAKAALYGDKVKVYGADYNTNDGTAERDYTHVCDIASAHLLAMDYVDNGGTEKVFNIGTGTSSSVLDIVNLFKERDLDIDYEIVERREGDVERTCADIQKARELLGYEPKYSLTDIITHSYAWEKRHKKKKL